eukprot:g6852.t1
MSDVCPAGWHKDMFHTAPGAPCVVTTAWLEPIVGAFTLTWGLCALTTGATVAALWRHGEAWTSQKMCALIAFTVASVLYSVGFVTLWPDLDAGLDDPRAPWRWMWFLAMVINFCIGWPMYTTEIMLPAVRFVAGLHQERFRELERMVGRFFWLTIFCMALAQTGVGMGFLGTSGPVQRSGAALCWFSYLAYLMSMGASFQRVAVMLDVSCGGLDATSNSAQQISSLSKLLRAFGWFCVCMVPAFIVSYAVPVTRELLGTAFGLLGGICGLWQAIIFPLYEYKRLAPASVAPVSATTARAAMSSRFSSRTIKAFVTATATEIAQDSQRRQLLLCRSERSASTTGAVVSNGVTLRFMREFADECGIGDGLSAAEVCARHVKPMTVQARAPMVAMLQDGRDGTGALWCGPPTAFISYAWSYPYRLLIDIVERFEEEHPPAIGARYYYFLDQLSLNQHQFVDEGANQNELQNQLVQVLESNMKSAAHVLMCLHPWSRPVPLRRMWCLFELFVAVQSKVKLTMCFGAEDADALYAAVANGNFSAEEAVGEIDAANAGASVVADKQMIMKLIHAQVGMQRFNAEM